jgi:hypothetical protein
MYELRSERRHSSVVLVYLYCTNLNKFMWLLPLGLGHPALGVCLCTKNLNLSSLCAFGAHTRSIE